MTAMYDEPTPSMVAAIARSTIDLHRATPGQTGPAAGCQQCTPTGCAQLDWAERELEAYRAERAARLAAPPTW